MYIEVNYKELGRSEVDVCLDIAEYNGTVEDCWKELERQREVERITVWQYNEIKKNVTFEIAE